MHDVTDPEQGIMGRHTVRGALEEALCWLNFSIIVSSNLKQTQVEKTTAIDCPLM